MPRFSSPFDNAQYQRDLLTPIILAWRLRAKLQFWWSADFLTVDSSGLVSGATDLTGKGSDGVQTTSDDRLTYFRSDMLFGGRKSFGSTTNVGKKSLEAPSSFTAYQAFLSWYYKDGVDNNADFANIIFSGLGIQSFPRLSIRPSATSIESFTASRTFNDSTDPVPQVNGFPAGTNLSLPLMPSVIRVQCAAGRTMTFHAGNASQVDQTPVGAYRNVVVCNQVLSDYETELIEGVIAWSDGLQRRLAPTHRFKNKPPLIGD